ncbi:MAG: M48 family metallopeptidase [Gammaproteobacteria bacterium]|nr:M48 family metallopeptidase [Gammaproteobacteria bacterium]
MKYTPKLPPEGINTSSENHLKEFALLTGGVLGIVLVTVAILSLLVNHLVSYIPIEFENEYFASQFIEHPVEEGKYHQTEIWLNQRVNEMRTHYSGEDEDKFRFHVRVVEMKEPNAFVFPGGNIGVTTGLLEMMETENGLVMVLAHEMAHQYKRHPLRSMGRGVVIGLTLMVFTGMENSSLVSNLIGNAAMLEQLAFSREQESDADAIGVELLQQTYGHASGATEFFRKMRNKKESRYMPPAFLSTHPDVENRILKLQEMERMYPGKTKPLPKFIKEKKVKSLVGESI